MRKTQPVRLYTETVDAAKAEPMPAIPLPERVDTLVRHGINRNDYHLDGYTKAVNDLLAAIERGETPRKAAERLLLEYRP